MTPTAVFDNIVNNLTTPRSDFFRFCLSDQVPDRLDQVIQGVSDPVTYAGRMVGKHYSTLKPKLPPLSYIPKKHPIVIDHLRAYDELISATMMMRLTHLYPTDLVRLHSLYATARMFLLTVNDKHYPISYGGGLTNFGSIVPPFIKNNPGNFTTTDVYFFTETIKYVSHIGEEDWIFWNKHWQTLFDRPARLKAFRHFLHACLAVFVMTEQAVQEIYAVSKDDIVVFMTDFIELRKSSTTKQAQVDSFTNRLMFYFNVETFQSGLSMLLEAPYYMVDLFYLECKEDPKIFHEQMTERYMKLRA